MLCWLMFGLDHLFGETCSVSNRFPVFIVLLVLEKLVLRTVNTVSEVHKLSVHLLVAETASCRSVM